MGNQITSGQVFDWSIIRDRSIYRYEVNSPYKVTREVTSSLEVVSVRKDALSYLLL